MLIDFIKEEHIYTHFYHSNPDMELEGSSRNRWICTANIYNDDAMDVMRGLGFTVHADQLRVYWMDSTEDDVDDELLKYIRKEFNDDIVSAYDLKCAWHSHHHCPLKKEKKRILI